MPTQTVIDTLPPSYQFSGRLEYPNLAGGWTECALRFYRRPPGQPERELRQPVIICSELPENRGTSVTNRAEVVFHRAWEYVERPWPCVFVEHYPGTDPRDPIFQEHASLVNFELSDRTEQPLQLVRDRRGDRRRLPVPRAGLAPHPALPAAAAAGRGPAHVSRDGELRAPVRPAGRAEMKPLPLLMPGTVVQIDPDSGPTFGGCFGVVEDVLQLGVQLYVAVPDPASTTRRPALVHLTFPWEQVEPVTDTAIWATSTVSRFARDLREVVPK